MQNYRPASDLLKDQVILVTGAGSGIGKAVAIAYAKHGAQVIVSGRNTGKLEAICDEISAKGYPSAMSVLLDLKSSNYADYTTVASIIKSKFGLLNGLVHNAGLLGELKPVSECDPGIWAEVMQVNVNAQFLLTRALLSLLRKAKKSAIIFTSSNVGIQGRANWGAYCVSKFATEGLAQVVADEEQKSGTVRVNVINPGRVRTAMRAQAYPNEDPAMVAAPEEIVPAYLYLMGSDSLDIHGERINA